MLVFESGNLRVFAGGSTRKGGPRPGMLCLDLAGMAHQTAIKINGPLVLPRTQTYAQCTIVRLDWPDMGTPAVGLHFWEGFLKDILDIAESRTEPLDLLVMCMGGHGRTGTAVAIIASMLGVVPEGADPVEWVRAKYCDEAVETDEQLDYVELITGRQVLVAASKWSALPYNYGNYTGSKYTGDDYYGKHPYSGQFDDDDVFGALKKE